ncbi:MAG: DUF1653 domain-containing protein [Rickettsiales bacterium]|jgi:hypothetical protein|nr:DUF1653 domain-containing protein [Rickettsiales bacterium]
MIKIGAKYRHYKGGLYQVVAFAQHSETLENLVVYQALYGERKVWCRPAAMWEEDVNGRPRFEILIEKRRAFSIGKYE